jgi:hypothetical protein
MAVTTQEKTAGTIGNDPTTTNESDLGAIKIDLTAPAGNERSLGAESVRDDRPATCDDVVEAMDEEGPGITAPLATEKASDG